MIDQLDWEKTRGLIPAVVQDADSGRVLMLGYMNREALSTTLKSGLVTFWSRSRGALWTKGETSGNHLHLRSIRADCDGDTLLVVASAAGPTCHSGTTSCFGDDGELVGLEFLHRLQQLIQSRRRELPEDSYTASLFRAGLPRICQKLGEEAVELIVSAMQSRERGTEEAADLIYHLLVFLAARDINLSDVVAELASRHASA